MARTIQTSYFTLFTMMMVLGAGCAAEVDGSEPLDGAPYDEELDESASHDDELDESEVLTEAITYPNCTITEAGYLGTSNGTVVYGAKGTGSGCSNACAAWASELNRMPAYAGYRSGSYYRSPNCTVWLYR